MMKNLTIRTLAGLCPLILAAVAIGWSGLFAGNTVTMTHQDAFAPKNVKVRAGETITWHNADMDNHTVDSDTGLFDSDDDFPDGIPPKARWSWTVPGKAASGTVYFYHCDFHGAAGNGTSYGTGMVGSITVK